MKFNQQIFDSLQDTIFIFNQDLVVVECNHAFIKQFNMLDLLLPLTFIEINRNLDFQIFLKDAVTKESISKLSGFTFDVIHNPLLRFFDISCLPLTNSELYICILHDITERKITEQIKEDFISNFSHEIKTPLTVLHGHIQVLKQEKDINKVSPIIQKMEFNSNRMINLFDDLLLLSSVEKKSEIKKELVNIDDNIQFVASDLLVNYPDKTIILEFSIEQKIFNIDLALFEQILINLIDNSIKYGSANGVIKISTYPEGDFDVLEITDSGAGIPANQLPRIFERFYRGEVSHESTIKGTGLGLAIVKHIVQKHDARIYVTSTLNVGSKFILHFKK